MRSLISFILFITVFLTLYGLLHAYFYFKLKSVIIISPLSNWLILAFLFIMLIAPILINVFIKYEWHFITTFLSYIAYTWMAVLFLFFSAHICMDIYNGVIHLFSIIFPVSFLNFKLGSMISFVVVILMVVGIISYGFFEAENIKVKEVVLETEKLPSAINSLKVLQISDIHFSAINSVRLARKIVDIINGLNPELLVSTGDLIERGLLEKEEVASLFRSIKTPYGKYAVTGNHEFYTGITKAIEFTENAGFKMLRNEGVTVGDVLNVVGLDDPTSKQSESNANVSENKILNEFSNKKFTILLKHQPTINKRSATLFDLQLSGHTHNGQIFPFRLITSLFFPYNNGLFQVGNNSYFYVNSGTGTWGPPVRFLSPPEITIFTFQRFESIQR